MRIRTQSLIAMLLFGAILSVVVASVIITSKQVERTSRQAKIAHDIAQGASELAYLSNDYLVYRESQQLKRWEARFASFSNQVAGLHADKPEQQVLVRNIETNQQRLKDVFDSVTSVLGTSSPNQGEGEALGPPLLQVSWSRMAVQIQGLVSDASRLSQLHRARSDRLKQTNMVIVFAMIGVFAGYFLVSYLIIQRRTLKSIAILQAGTAVIGSGNLDFIIEEKSDDEIGELSRAFNRMTADLKAVTASKADLEREIAEREKAEEALRNQREWLRVTLSSIGDAVMTTDTEGRVTFLNPTAQSLTGRQLEEAAGQPARTVFHIINEKTREPAEDIVQRVLREERMVTLANHTALVTPDGREIPIEDSAAPIKDGAGNLIGVVLVFHDVTEKRRSQEALRKAHDDLEWRVRERTAALGATVARLELINQELQDFAHVASHDLQEPLRKIQTFCDLATTRCGPALDSVGQGYLERVLSSASRMRHLLDDLLQYSRVATRPEPYRLINLENIVREAADIFEEPIKAAGALVEIENMPNIEADEAQILRLFQNLIGNALKFRRDEGLRIKLSATQDETGVCEVFVEDNGIGFDQHFAERIFKPFQRLHSRNHYEGTGMGLAICRKIAERHGGSIRAESELGRGSTFIIRLPVKQDKSCLLHSADH